MNSFKDLGITVEGPGLIGNKIQMYKILNVEIVVVKYKIERSKFEGKGTGKCLHMQIKFKGENHVVFSGSGVLMDTIEKIPKEAFPFTTTIVKDNERYVFT